MNYWMRSLWIMLGAALLGIALLGGRAFAQTRESGASHQASQQGETIEGELAKEEKAAEHGTEGLKHSASVRLLSKITGLDVHNAYWVAVFLNLAIIVGIIGWFGRKSLPGMFKDRTASIQKAMEEARQASAEANRRLAEIESRLGKLDVEIGSMQAHAEKEVEAEEQRIAQATQEEARKIVESAEEEIASAAKVARRELKSYAAELAVNLAAKQIKVDANTDQALVEQFARELTANGGRKDS